jgi:hypothetical protein
MLIDNGRPHRKDHGMRLGLTRTLVLLTGTLTASAALGADVAVMPVQGVNLTDGESEAIGVLFTNAFAREARVAAASPLQTKSLRAAGDSSTAVAGQLGAAKYIELSALQLERKVMLAGILYDASGSVLYRAETSAANLDGMEPALTALARALAFRQPVRAAAVARGADALPQNGYEAPPSMTGVPDAKTTRGAYGPKVGLAIAKSSDRSFSPSFLVQFDGRLGPRNYFLEFGAGLLVPMDDSTSTSSIRMGAGFLEFGASYYLWAGSTAMYVGAGLSPALWETEYGYATRMGATCSAYGQVGMTFTRDMRVKIYAEFRVAQLLLAVTDPGFSSGANGETTFRPTMLSFQGGVGF